jgi:hypothetical protein
LMHFSINIGFYPWYGRPGIELMLTEKISFFEHICDVKKYQRFIEEVLKVEHDQNPRCR